MAEEARRRGKAGYKAAARERYWAAFNRNACILNLAGCLAFWAMVLVLQTGLLPPGPAILAIYLSQVVVGAGTILCILALIYSRSATWKAAIYWSAIITLPTDLIILAPFILAAGTVALF